MKIGKNSEGCYWSKQLSQWKTFRVGVGRYKKAPADLPSGVPHGSVRGPALFFVFSNGIEHVVWNPCYLSIDVRVAAVGLGEDIELIKS